MPRQRLNNAALLIWALVRLPGAAMLVYLLRHSILNLIEPRFDILIVTRFVIDLLSTPATRVVAATAAFCVLLSIVASVRRLRPVVAYAILLAATAASTALAFSLAETSMRRAGLVLAVFAANLAPSQWFGFVKRLPRVWNAIMIAGVGVAELLVSRQYCQWLRQRLGNDRPSSANPSLAGALSGLLLTSFAFAGLVRGEALLPFEQMLRMPEEVQLLDERLSVNWIEVDSSGMFLYATGHTLPHLRRYDLRNPLAPPMTSRVSTGGSQGFAYDPQAREIYAFNTHTKQLLSFDAETLEGRWALDLPELSPGDPWVVVDGISDTLTVVSEADLRTGVPFIVLDRATGLVLDESDLDAGNVLRHPTRPWLYLSFFRRRNEVLLYDLQKKVITYRAQADSRAERMAFWKGANELLVTSPMESRVIRFDADHLQLKGYIPAQFGVRAIAVDERRDLLLCGNIATGRITVIDLQSGESLRSYYLGPWLRTIQVHVESGTAYVSSNGALYRLAYAPPLAQ